MKKSKFSMIAVMAFYIAAGVLACTFFFLRGSSLSGEEASARTELYDIKPQLSQASETEPAPTPEASQPETSPAESEYAQSEPETSEAEISDTTEAPKYYAFTTLNFKGNLHVREAASMNAKIIARFTPGISGYVIELGPTWSLVTSGDITGYVFNEYLEFTEIPEEEYPLR